MKRIIDTPEAYSELQRECIKRVREYVSLAQRTLNFEMREPTIQFNLKGTTAGTANSGKNLIRFSAVLMRENPDEFIEVITGHEVAHLVAHIKFGHGIDPHGREWARVMQVFGLPAKRCHAYDTRNVPSQFGKHSNGVRQVRTEEGLVTIRHGCKIIEF